jgi:hypothetical protein
MKTAIRLLIASGVAMVASPSAGVDSIFAPLVSSKSPGAAVLVRKNGNTIVQRGYGVRDLRSLSPIDARTDCGYDKLPAVARPRSGGLSDSLEATGSRTGRPRDTLEIGFILPFPSARDSFAVGRQLSQTLVRCGASHLRQVKTRAGGRLRNTGFTLTLGK